MYAFLHEIVKLLWTQTRSGLRTSIYFPAGRNHTAY